MIDLSEARNIVIRLPNWIGDAVMAAPSVNCIKRNLPEIEVWCLGKPAVNQLYRYNSNVDSLIDLRLNESGGRLSSIKAFSKSLRHHRFDVGLILPDSFSSALILRMGGVRLRAGYRSELRSFMLTHPVKPPSVAVHRSQRYIHLVKQAFGIEKCDGSIAVEVSEREVRRADRFLDGSGRFAVICPISRAPSRRWGRDKYAELMRRISGELGLKVVLAGSGDESRIVEEVGRLSGVDFMNLAEENDILMSIEVMRRSEVFVGNDSGAAHLAAASGTRVVSISGADDPDETRPLAETGVVVRGQLDCIPCVKNVCPRKDHVNECMDIVSVDSVFTKVCEMLERGNSAGIP